MNFYSTLTADRLVQCRARSSKCRGLALLHRLPFYIGLTLLCLPLDRIVQKIWLWLLWLFVKSFQCISLELSFGIILAISLTIYSTRAHFTFFGWWLWSATPLCTSRRALCWAESRRKCPSGVWTERWTRRATVWRKIHPERHGNICLSLCPTQRWECA